MVRGSTPANRRHTVCLVLQTSALPEARLFDVSEMTSETAGNNIGCCFNNIGIFLNKVPICSGVLRGGNFGGGRA